MTEKLELEGKVILAVPTGPCRECMENEKGQKLVRSKSANAVAFYCPECQLGAYCFEGIGIWHMAQPISRKAWTGIINSILVGNVDPAALN